MNAENRWGGVAVLTGGTKGMGLAIAQRVAPLVDKVVLVYRSDDEAAAAARQAVEAAGGAAVLIKGDVASEQTFYRLAELLEQSGTHVSLVVHGAVDTTTVDLLVSDPADIRASVEANGMSMILTARAVDRHLTEGSLVVFLSSKGAVAALGGYAGIGVPKAMAEAALRYLAMAWAPRGVRALVLAPGAVDTGSFRAAFPDADTYLSAAAARTPMGRLATPEDVADAVVQLRDPGMSLLTGARVLLDGGVSLL